jgi:tRNA(Ile)-lysidine synthase
MLEQVEHAIKKLGPYDEGETVILACSGGADSTFLAYSWAEISKAITLPSPVVVVVNHCQQSSSETNANRAAKLYARLNFENVEVRDVPSTSLKGEHDLRKARYAILERAARDYGANKIFLGHHADDQAETILQRIMRGTGINGLASMSAKKKLDPRYRISSEEIPLAHPLFLCRPLLALRAFVIREFLSEVGISWIEDPTNQEVDYAVRNRIRKEIMPSLELIATGDPVKALNKLVFEAQDWQACVDECLQESRLFREEPSYLRRQRLRLMLKANGETVSPQRLSDLEGALLDKGSAVINEQLRFSLKGGSLSVVSRG